MLNDAAKQELTWKKFKVLNDGFVCLVDVMGDDSSITQAARVSYGNDTREGSEADQTKDRDLIRYLMRHRHSTPLEMAEVKLLVRVPMDCWRQWIRHRTANVNEYSTRYTEAIDSQQTTKPYEWRLQATNNKQGSSGTLTEWPGNSNELEAYNVDIGLSLECTPGEYLTRQEELSHQASAQLYKQRLKFGIAKEQARKDLPLSTYTEAYWKCDLHNILGFLSLRMDSHAQKEIRDYATVIGEQIIKPLFPLVWEAFTDYRLKGLVLSGPEIKTLRAIALSEVSYNSEIVKSMIDQSVLGKREQAEFTTKLEQLGLL